MAEVTRRRLLAGSLPVLGAGAIALHETVSHPHPWVGDAHAAEDGHNGHGGSEPVPGVHPEGHAGFRGPSVDHVANGFDPHTILRDFDWGSTRRLANGRVVREWELVARDKEIEVAARRQVRRLDLQRPCARTDAALPRGRAAADHLRQRLRAPAHDPLPRHPPVERWTAFPGSVTARSRRAGARCTSSRPCRPACTSTTATCGRSPSTSPRGCTARSSSTRRIRAKRPTRW